MKPLSTKQRLRHYIILAGGILAVPVVVTLLCVILTGSRVAAVGMATIPSVVIIHGGFGLLFLKGAGREKYAISIMAAIIAVFLFWLVAFKLAAFSPFALGLMFGYMLFIVLSALFWEGIYRVLVWVHSLIGRFKG